MKRATLTSALTLAGALAAGATAALVNTRVLESADGAPTGANEVALDAADETPPAAAWSRLGAPAAPRVATTTEPSPAVTDAAPPPTAPPTTLDVAVLGGLAVAVESSVAPAVPNAPARRSSTTRAGSTSPARGTTVATTTVPSPVGPGASAAAPVGPTTTVARPDRNVHGEWDRGDGHDDGRWSWPPNGPAPVPSMTAPPAPPTSTTRPPVTTTTRPPPTTDPPPTSPPTTAEPSPPSSTVAPDD